MKKTINDIVKMDNDVTFQEYLDMCEKTEECFRNGDDNQLNLYLALLQSQEETLVEIFKYRLSQQNELIKSVNSACKSIDKLNSKGGR